MGVFLSDGSAATKSGRAARRVWTAADGSARIAFTAEVLEKLRFECSCAMHGVAGLGIGGLLVGAVDDDCACVIDRIPIKCQHSQGLDFRLTPDEAQRLSLVVREISEDNGASATQLLGWFISHPRGDGGLTAEESSLHARSFQSRHFALILKPERSGDVEGFVHLPGSGGPACLVFASPAFTVEPLPAVRRSLRGRRHAMDAAPDEKPAAPAAPAAQPSPRNRKKLLLAAGIALCALLACGVAAYSRFHHASSPAQPPVQPIEMVSLHAADHDGRFEISWNASADAVVKARRASLIIEDGGTTLRRELSLRDARSGLQYYRRQSEKLTVTLVLESADGLKVEESTRFEPGLSSGEEPQSAAPRPEIKRHTKSRRR